MLAHIVNGLAFAPEPSRAVVGGTDPSRAVDVKKNFSFTGLSRGKCWGVGAPDAAISTVFHPNAACTTSSHAHKQVHIIMPQPGVMAAFTDVSQTRAAFQRSSSDHYGIGLITNTSLVSMTRRYLLKMRSLSLNSTRKPWRGTSSRGFEYDAGPPLDAYGQCF